MRVTIDLSDDLYESLRRHAGATKDDRQAVNTEIKKRLERIDDLSLTKDRWFVVGGDERRKIEHIFQTTVTDAADLAKRTEKLNRFGIGDVTRPLTEGEAITLEGQATFWGQTAAEYLSTTINRVLDETLNRV